MAKVPDKNTRQWIKNETTINNNPQLKRARDIAEGIEKPASAYSNNGGKGHAAKSFVYSKQYKDNWDKIFGGDRGNVNHRDSDE